MGGDRAGGRGLYLVEREEGKDVRLVGSTAELQSLTGQLGDLW